MTSRDRDNPASLSLQREEDCGKGLCNSYNMATDREELAKCYQEITFQVPWGVIAAKAWGPEDGQSFIGLHGWLDNANTFDKLAPLLPENIRFVAIDFPGHGQSSHRWPGMGYDNLEYVADVKKIVSQLRWERFSIIGHSMGGFVGSLYAGCFPDEVENLVLIDCGGPPPRFGNNPAKVLARYATRMSNMKPASPRIYESVESAAARREEPVEGNTLSKGDALLITKRGTRVTKDGVIFSHDPVVKGLFRTFYSPEVSFKLILSKIRCALLVLEGTASIYKDEEDNEGLEDRLILMCQHAKFYTWKSIQGGHHCHLDNPEQTAKEIKQFLAHCGSQNFHHCTSKL